MRIDVITAPAVKPMDVAEARAHVRQDLAIDDAALDAWIRSAAAVAQTLCQRTLIATRYRATMDAFCSGTIRLEKGPVLAVRSVRYLDTSGAWQTVDPSVYVVDASGDFARVALAFGQVWPTTLQQVGSVRIDYDAGDAAGISASKETDVLTIRGGLWRTLAVGDVVRLSNSGGVLPTPLNPDVDYYVQAVPSAASLKLADTLGGPAIDITSAGSGTHYIGAVPADVLAWMKLRIGGLYEVGGDLVQNLQAHPYADAMLDGSSFRSV